MRGQLLVKKIISFTLQLNKVIHKTVATTYEGTYVVKVISYPWSSGQVGDERNVLVFTDFDKCYGHGQENRILFNNLFSLGNCSAHEFADMQTFVLDYEDNQNWYGAPIKGEGSIFEVKNQFEGVV